MKFGKKNAGIKMPEKPAKYNRQKKMPEKKLSEDWIGKMNIPKIKCRKV